MSAASGAAPGTTSAAGRVVVALAAAAVAVAASGAVAGALGPSGPGTGHLALGATGLSAIFALGRWAFLPPGRAGLWRALALALAATAAAYLARWLGLVASTGAGVLAGAAVAEATGQSLVRAPAMATLPAGRRSGVLLGALALGMLVLWSGFQRDPDLVQGKRLGPLFEPHQCLAAYVRAAELAEARPNALYDLAAYVPAADRRRTSSIAHLDPHLMDPYQYPPGFLVLPGLALSVTSDFLELRPLWFGAQLTLFLLLAYWLTVPLASPRAWILLAALVASVPVLVNFQMGQVHLLMIAAAVAAVVAFERGHTASGGALLGLAAGSKLFPGVLALPLLLQRRWRALAWSGFFGILGLLSALLWFGPEPLWAFFRSQLGDLAGGQAFAKFRASEGFVTENLGLSSIPAKIGAVLALPTLGIGAAFFQFAAYGFALVLAVLVGRRDPRGPAAPLAWLAVLNATALASPYAPTDYVMAGVLWLLALYALEVVRTRRTALLAAAVWLFLLASPLYPGLPILWRQPRLLALLGLCEQAVAVALCVLAVRVRDRAAWQASPGAQRPDVAGAAM